MSVVPEPAFKRGKSRRPIHPSQQTPSDPSHPQKPTLSATSQLQLNARVELMKGKRDCCFDDTISDLLSSLMRTSLSLSSLLHFINASDPSLCSEDYLPLYLAYKSTSMAGG